MTLKKIVGGELRAYTQMREETRREAASRKVSQAKKLSADAVVRFSFQPQWLQQTPLKVIRMKFFI